jgi:hypothetical protein
MARWDAAMYNPRLSDPRRLFFCEDWAPRSESARTVVLAQGNHCDVSGGALQCRMM